MRLGRRLGIGALAVGLLLTSETPALAGNHPAYKDSWRPVKVRVADLLSRMRKFMSFRGPDGIEIWTEYDVGFSQTLLRTNAQELTSIRNDDFLLTADVRIDGCGNTDLTDVERILRAYETWGEDCVAHLIGDFAFAIWDKRKRRLFCARDHFGVKPFFYARVGNSFVFSNTLNVLRLDRRVSDELNEKAVADYLELGLNQDLSSTVFRDIHRLPAGHTLSLANGSITTRCYWTPAVKREVRFRKPEDYVEQFNEIFSAAVKDRLRTDRVSISMSGGLRAVPNYSFEDAPHPDIVVIGAQQGQGAPVLLEWLRARTRGPDRSEPSPAS